jgi:kinesin family protein 1
LLAGAKLLLSWQHFRLGDPFTEPILPQYSLVGDVDVPLTAIFESRSQDFALDVTSPHTQSVVGIIKLTIEPSEAETRSTLKFNVIMRDMIGFAEREGTQVHAQMFVPGVSDESGATTTTMVSDFDEGPIRFDSVHSMSLSLGSPLRNATLRVAIFAKITAMHLEKLISWDDMRDQSNTVLAPRKKSARLNETEFYTEERHDVFARVQLLELSESGEYLPVEVVQQTDVDPGAFQLHQGLQRRLQLSLTHSSGEALQWNDVVDVRIGSVRLLDPRGKIPDLSSPTKEVRLSTILGPVVKTNADGTSTVTVVAQWDSSLHNSILLDRTTADKYRVQMCLRWNVVSERLSEPILFSLDIAAQIQPRLLRSSSKFMQLWNNNRIVHAGVGLYQLVIRPAAARRAGDLWRMNTSHRYVKGEEYLSGWTPRSISLVRDFIAAKRRRMRVAEVENAKGFLNSLPVTRTVTPTAATVRREPMLPGQQQQPITRPVGRVLGNGQVPQQQTEEPITTSTSPAETPPATPASSAEGGESAEQSSTADLASDAGDAETKEQTVAPPEHETPLQEREPPPPEDDPNMQVLRKFVGLWSSWKDPSEVSHALLCAPSPHKASAIIKCLMIDC